MLSEILAIAISVEYLEKSFKIIDYIITDAFFSLFLSPALFRTYDA